MRSVNHDNKVLLHLVDDLKILNCCVDRQCKCGPCALSRESAAVTANGQPSTAAEPSSAGQPSTAPKEEKIDNDSDSGISVEISNNLLTPSTTPVIR